MGSRNRGGKSGVMADTHTASATAEDIANNLTRLTCANRTTAKASNANNSANPVNSKPNPPGKTKPAKKNDSEGPGDQTDGAGGGHESVNTSLPSLSLSPLPKMPLIDDPSKADNETLSKALNTLYELLQGNIHQTNANLGEISGKLQTLEDKLDNVQERQINFEAKINHKLQEQDKRFEYQAKKMGVLESTTVKVDEFASLKSDFHKVTEELEDRFQAMANEILNLKIDNIRTATDTQRLEERVNVHDLRAKKHSFIVDGFPESPQENVCDDLIARLNNDSATDFTAEDFISIRRMGKLDPNKQGTWPRPIAVVVDITRSKLLNSRGNLSKNADGSLIWLNEELPPAYRRRKAMLRDLVKLAIKKGHSAKIEAGGINLNGKLYLPPDFPDLPDDLQPHMTRITTNAKGNLIFAGEYAYVSNMFKCSFKLDGVHYTSGEQCFQFTKARFLNNEHTAQRILSNNDPFECKRLGDELERPPPWVQVQETKLLEILRAKFNQNDDLKQRLVETGNVKLL